MGGSIRTFDRMIIDESVEVAHPSTENSRHNVTEMALVNKVLYR